MNIQQAIETKRKIDALSVFDEPIGECLVVFGLQLCTIAARVLVIALPQLAFIDATFEQMHDHAIHGSNDKRLTVMISGKISTYKLLT